jgi:phage-related protein
MTDTFTWRVQSDANGGGEFRTAKAQFGNGYAQEATLGLNPDVQSWNVTVNAYHAEMQTIIDFIRDNAGVSFYWTPPFGVQGYYKCKTYKPQDQGGGLWTLALTFEQAFLP